MENQEKSAFLNPYLAGFLIGLVIIVSYLVLGTGLGASGGIARLSAWCGICINPDHILKSTYFGGWGEKPLHFYIVYMFAGIFIGGFLSSLTSGRISVQTERGKAYPAVRRLLIALAGGIIAGFASRLTRGCSSGAGLSGLAVLNTAGFVFIISVFASGFITAWFFRRQWHD